MRYTQLTKVRQDKDGSPVEIMRGTEESVCKAMEGLSANGEAVATFPAVLKGRWRRVDTVRDDTGLFRKMKNRPEFIKQREAAGHGMQKGRRTPLWAAPLLAR